MSRSILGSMIAATFAAPVALAAGTAGQPRPAARQDAPKTAPAAKTAAPADEAARFFTKEVQPLLKAKCLGCHTGASAMGGLRLTSRAEILKGGASGAVVDLEKPESSLFVHAINYKGKKMPPQGKMAPAQIETLTKWVAMGMPWPAGDGAKVEEPKHHGPPQVNAETMRFWSFQPLKRPAVPAVKNKAWVRNPVDAFVLTKLEANGLKPNPSASRAALIRRAYYDLIGLPPTPDEVDAFLADKSPDAWEKVVDRLLASPQYGEKWGRHWLDLVRYAESNSYERDGAKPFAWRYRDYVIQSFNADKPYPQFIQEQLAGDEMPERTPERVIATGYYRLGLWDDEPADPKQALYDDLDDIASTTSQVFLGLTLGCARCHDHKLDPLPTKDYYKFVAFFNGVKRYGVRSEESVREASLRPIAAPELVKQQQEEAEAYQAKLREVTRSIFEIDRPVRQALTPVEQEEFRTESYRPRILKKYVPSIVSQEQYDRYVQLHTEREKLRANPPKMLEMALCVTEEAKPRETFILLRGNPHVPGDRVEPGFPAVLAPPQPELAASPHADTSGRRTALAKWIASPANPLTARVMVNRVWQYHFGRGIVRSTSNFGFQGDKPTHPELLDWLASDYQANGWHLKPLHRMLMLSSTYRMSSETQAPALAKDPENDLMWRFDMRRLQAEEIRDSILAVNGSLNPKMGGPSVYPTIPDEVLAGQSMPGAGWGKSTPEEQRRRSVYVFVKRSLALPLIAAFDGPETDFTCPVRFATTQPTQALGMLNSTWLNDQARVFAASLVKAAGSEHPAQVRLALRRVLQREPSKAEVDRGVRFIEALEKEEGAKPDDALASYCLLALNLNEFVYLD